MNAQAQYQEKNGPVGKSGTLLSTVLAQDRFFSDSLSFTLGIQDPQSHHDDEDSRPNPRIISSFWLLI